MFKSNLILVIFVVTVYLTSAVTGIQEISALLNLPVLLGVNSTLDIPLGTNLTLQCEGQYPLEWILPELNHESSNERSNITNYDTNKSVYKYKSILTLNEMEYKDTGSYICCYHGTVNCSFAKENTTSVYIFVNDPNNFFLPDMHLGLYLFHDVHQGQMAIIPCLPTNSHFNVTFWKILGMGEYEFVASRYDIVFDPTKGIIIEYPSLYFDGNFECKIEYENVTDDIPVSLVYFARPQNPPAVHIFLRNGNLPVINSTFSISCDVRYEIGDYAFVEWKYPNQNNSRITETRKFNVIRLNGYNYHQTITNLTVSQAQVNDSGWYICTATDHAGQINTAKEEIHIETRNIPGIILHTDINVTNPIIRRIGEEARFVITISVFPYSDEISLHWLKDEKHLSNNSHYEIKSLNYQSSLTIKSVSELDSATYTLFVRSGNMTNNLSITLYAYAKPFIKIKGGKSFYMLNEEYTLSCHGKGYPHPSVWWSWQLGNGPEITKTNRVEKWMEIELPKEFPNIINETVQNQSLAITSSLRVVAKQSGYYRCEASNELGYEQQIVPFYVTDSKNGFEIILSQTQPIITEDRITLTCKASIHHYRQVSWKWIPAAKNTSLIRANSSGIQVLSKSTNYSEVEIIEFESINMNDSGKYICDAVRRNASLPTEQHDITIEVADIVSPYFVDTNMNESDFIIETERKFEFRCYVKGTPPPQIIWYKNGDVYDVSNMSGIELVDSSQKLIINRVIARDAGSYHCRAVNRGGTIIGKIMLNVVRDEPVMARKLTKTETSIIIVCVIIGILLFSLTIILVRKMFRERKEKEEMKIFSHKQFHRGQLEMLNPELPLDDQIELLPYDNRWEFPKERLKLGKTLGQGAFGRVVKAEAIGIEDGETSTTVAVKMLKERTDTYQRKALMAELKILIHLGSHLNIVNLLGAVTKNMVKGELMVIVEYCCYGNLRHFLLQKQKKFINQLDPETGIVDPSICTLPGSPGIENIEKMAAVYESTFSSGLYNPNYGNQSIHYAELLHRQRSYNSGGGSFETTVKTTTTELTGSSSNPSNDGIVTSGSTCKDNAELLNQPVTTCDLLCYAFQCARGMEYLISRKLIHRDLAARNVLLTENNVVKICDFGLAKDCYKYSNYVKKGDGPLPIKWMAIESIRDKVFTAKSDVWSFGVLLWEFFTLGGNPYPGIDIDGEFYKQLRNGYRMERPEYAPMSVYEIMQNCWLAEPKERPNFTELAEEIGELLQASVRKFYIELNMPYLVMNEEMLNNNDYLQMDDSGKVNYINIQKSTDDVKSSAVEHYDNIGTVRPVGDGPVPKAPMEVVPMIQLEPVNENWAKPIEYDQNSEAKPTQDLLAMTPPFNMTTNESNYLCMSSPKDVAIS